MSRIQQIIEPLRLHPVSMDERNDRSLWLKYGNTLLLINGRYWVADDRQKALERYPAAEFSHIDGRGSLTPLDKKKQSGKKKHTKSKPVKTSKKPAGTKQPPQLFAEDGDEAASVKSKQLDTRNYRAMILHVMQPSQIYSIRAVTDLVESYGMLKKPENYRRVGGVLREQAGKLFEKIEAGKFRRL